MNVGEASTCTASHWEKCKKDTESLQQGCPVHDKGEQKPDRRLALASGWVGYFLGINAVGPYRCIFNVSLQVVPVTMKH